MSSLANLDSREGNVSAEITLEFNFKPRKISVINDSLSYAMKVKFNVSETPMTVKKGEQLSLEVAHRRLIIASEDGVVVVPYRIWGIG